MRPGGESLTLLEALDVLSIEVIKHHEACTHFIEVPQVAILAVYRDATLADVGGQHDGQLGDQRLEVDAAHLGAL